MLDAIDQIKMDGGTKPSLPTSGLSSKHANGENSDINSVFQSEQPALADPESAFINAGRRNVGELGKLEADAVAEEGDKVEDEDGDGDAEPRKPTIVPLKELIKVPTKRWTKLDRYGDFS